VSNTDHKIQITLGKRSNSYEYYQMDSGDNCAGY
jgi:hypothetical protein